ncbi:MAG: MBL fold metallo-hydrolase [Treponema sp.]|jgi:glyoxylase-like metal-dependent hydrolase (beta-lactamase superfamily II)|nr:MBL fold metallo-hydrolase [Treponema sp.]
MKDLQARRLQPLVVGAIATNCWILPLDAADGNDAQTPSPEGPRPCVIIDPGEEAETILAQLRKLRWYPAYILLTHGHYDHLAALPELLAKTSAEAKAPVIAIHREDASYLGSGAYQLHRQSFAAAGGQAYVEQLWRPMPSPDRLLQEGDRIGPFTTLHLPGHTPGSIGFYLEAQKILFSGDTLFQAGIGRTDLPGGDQTLLDQSLERLLAMDGDIVVYPGHGDATTIQAERAWY